MFKKFVKKIKILAKTFDIYVKKVYNYNCRITKDNTNDIIGKEKYMKNLKLISTILLSVMLIFTISTAVFADDENNDIWSEPTVEENNTTENTNNTETENNETNENAFNDVEVENTDDNDYNNLYNTTNNTSTTSNSENLADTGIGDSSAIALIIIVSAVVAIYSAKKFNEYKNV